MSSLATSRVGRRGFGQAWQRGQTRSLQAGRRAGMTLVEVLVAMVILLVGVWAVAKGFPGLLRSVTLEQDRTQAARLAEARLEWLKQVPAALPTAVHGPLASAHLIDPDSDPESAPGQPNSLEHVYWVEGERVRVPAPQPGSSYALVALSGGLISRDPTTVQAWIVEPLEPLAFDPGSAAPAGHFYLRGDGVVTVPAGYDGIVADYVWVRDAGGGNRENHWVQGERILAPVDPSQPNQFGVAAKASPDFVATHTAPAHVEGLRALPVGSFPPAPGQVAIEPEFGAGLVFNQAEAGQIVLIDYKLRVTQGPSGEEKRTLYLTEDYVLGEAESVVDGADPSMRVATIQLGWGGLESLFAPPEVPADHQTAVVGVNLTSGDLYWEGHGIPTLDAEQRRAGRLQLRFPAALAGSRVRFFYSTADQACIQIYKPPITFFDASFIAPTYPGFRLYGATDEAGPHGPVRILHFAPCHRGFSVAVDYVYRGADGQRHLVSGELHTLKLDSGGGEAVCALNYPQVEEVRAVRGVSVRVRAWWRSPAGRLMHYDLDSFLAPLGAV
jgi:prepilin-type N-terminal cleavage/methylation domain-containing protein